jgi:hypothetical protein
VFCQGHPFLVAVTRGIKKDKIIYSIIKLYSLAQSELQKILDEKNTHTHKIKKNKKRKKNTYLSYGYGARNLSMSFLLSPYRNISSSGIASVLISVKAKNNDNSQDLYQLSLFTDVLTQKEDRESCRELVARSALVPPRSNRLRDR